MGKNKKYTVEKNEKSIHVDLSEGTFLWFTQPDPLPETYQILSVCYKRIYFTVIENNISYYSLSPNLNLKTARDEVAR